MRMIQDTKDSSSKNKLLQEAKCNVRTLKVPKRAVSACIDDESRIKDDLSDHQSDIIDGDSNIVKGSADYQLSEVSEAKV